MSTQLAIATSSLTSVKTFESYNEQPYVRTQLKGFFTQEFVVYERDFFYWTPHSIPAVSADILANSWVKKTKEYTASYSYRKK